MLRNTTVFCIAVLAGSAQSKRLNDNRQESKHDFISENEGGLKGEIQILPKQKI